MGVELKLLPIDFMSDVVSYSHQVLNFGKNYDFFEALDKLPSMPVPSNFSSFVSLQEQYEGQPEEEIPEDTHYGKTTMDPMGNEVRWVLAGDLKKLFPKFPAEDWSKRQVCTIAYINALEDTDKVALFYC